MARLARVVAVGVPHHITQRGNGRQVILTSDAERTVYMDLLRQAAKLHSLTVLGYCLMSNHVHLVAIPEKAESLARAMKETHGRYATYWNTMHGKSGHAWQGRFYSCPLDEIYLWEAMRYTELNPVRAGMVDQPELWKWSSAGAHCGRPNPTSALPWKGGNRYGPWHVGKNFWGWVKPRSNCRRFDSVPIPVDRSDQRHSSKGWSMLYGAHLHRVKAVALLVSQSMTSKR